MGPQIRVTLLAFCLGFAFTSLWKTCDCKKTDLCTEAMCISLDICQSVAQNLNSGLKDYESNSREIQQKYNMTEKTKPSELLDVTRRYLRIFQSLRDALKRYMEGNSYENEKRNIHVSIMNILLKHNLSLLIDFTDDAVENMAWTLNKSTLAATGSLEAIQSEKVSVYSIMFTASKKFTKFLMNWRRNCKLCGLKSRDTPKPILAQTRDRTLSDVKRCVCPEVDLSDTNAKREKNKSNKPRQKQENNKKKKKKTQMSSQVTEKTKGNAG